MPTRLPNKPLAKSIQANEVRAAALHSRKLRSREARADKPVDWLAVWAMSLGFCAITLAGIAFFAGADPVGASFILVGAASIIGVVLRASVRPGDYH